MRENSNKLNGSEGSSDYKLGRLYTPLGSMLAGISDQALHILTFEHLNYKGSPCKQLSCNHPSCNHTLQKPLFHKKEELNAAVYELNPKLKALFRAQGFFNKDVKDAAIDDGSLTEGTLLEGSLAVNHPLLSELQRQLSAFFDKKLKTFDLPLAPKGTAFQQQAWKALQAIPYGETGSYTSQAAAIGKPKAMRAVALANARNPISLIIPCHRVIGSDGALRGYASGVERKAHLLELES